MENKCNIVEDVIAARKERDEYIKDIMLIGDQSVGEAFKLFCEYVMLENNTALIKCTSDNTIDALRIISMILYCDYFNTIGGNLIA